MDAVTAAEELRNAKQKINCRLQEVSTGARSSVGG